MGDCQLNKKDQIQPLMNRCLVCGKSFQGNELHCSPECQEVAPEQWAKEGYTLLIEEEAADQIVWPQSVSRKILFPEDHQDSSAEDDNDDFDIFAGIILNDANEKT